MVKGLSIYICNVNLSIARYVFRVLLPTHEQPTTYFPKFSTMKMARKQIFRLNAIFSAIHWLMWLTNWILEEKGVKSSYITVES